MRLTEIIAALCVMAASFPPLASGLKPLYRAYSGVTVMQRNLDRNKFVSASFMTLEKESEIDEWIRLTEQLTATVPEVRKIARNNDTELFRAQLESGGQSHCVDTIFNRRLLI